MKLLHLDIETSPNLVYSWGLFKQNIAINQIVEPGATLCWAAKWHGKPGVMFNSVYKSGVEDMVGEVHDLITEADAIIHYNGTRFDMPKLNNEFLLLDMDPPAPYKQIDLLWTARKQFKLASNKLDFVAQHLGLGAKTKHMGMSLWRDCMNGCPKAWKIMERYNKQDVKLLEKVYKRLLPWIKNHPSLALYLDSDRPVCTNCGSHKVEKRGLQHNKTMTYQRYQCKGCGTWMRARKNCTTENAKENQLVQII